MFNLAVMFNSLTRRHITAHFTASQLRTLNHKINILFYNMKTLIVEFIHHNSQYGTKQKLKKFSTNECVSLYRVIWKVLLQNLYATYESLGTVLLVLILRIKYTNKILVKLRLVLKIPIK